MTGKDAIELRKRLKKDCSITRVAGCYVDSNKEQVVTFSEPFISVDELESLKYLEIAKKTLSGSIGNNILELDFETIEEQENGMQKLMYDIRESGLKDEALLQKLYTRIIDNYSYPDNYLILLFHDRYDVMKQTSDGQTLDESEEVFEYILGAVCPVVLSKPGLGYISGQNRIGAVARERVVDVPQIGFLFPAFDDRSADIHKIDYYVKDVKDGEADFAEEVMGCVSRRTAFQQRNTFAGIVKSAYRNESDKYDDMIMEIQDSFNTRVEEKKNEGELEAEKPIVLDERLMNEVLEENKVEVDVAKDIIKGMKEEFVSETPTVNNLVDKRAVKAYAPKKREKELIQEVVRLKAEIEQPDYDVTIRVAPDKAELVKAEIVETELYLLIPMEGNEHVSVNGVEREFE